MTKTITPAPVRRSIEVKAPQAKAFDVFTKKPGSWWPKSHHIGKVDFTDVVIEPKPKGRWYERGVDGSECEWGYVLAWNPPASLTLAWQLNDKWQFDRNLVTEVEIRFVPLDASRTRVELEHRNLERFGDAAQRVSESVGSDGGWPGILRSFATAAEQ